MTTAVDLEVLLHYNTSAYEHPERNVEPAVSGACVKLVHDGILANLPAMPNAAPSLNRPASLGLTDKGRAWLDMLLSTPYPQERWVDPRDGKPLPVKEKNPGADWRP